MNEPVFEEKFIAFVDILGFKQLVDKAESTTACDLSKILDLISSLGKKEDMDFYGKYGPEVCPESQRINKNMGFTITQISDCAIISTEVSQAGIINLISHCSKVVLRLLQEGIMCRGYVTKGSVYHTPSQIIGSGYNEAYSKESGVRAFQNHAEDLGTPFIEIDKVICDYIEKGEDQCVKKMFQRMVKSDGTVTAIFPFQRLSHSFGIGGILGELDAEKERQSNNNVRNWINTFKEKVWSQIDLSNESAVTKAKHYLAILDEQLKICDETDKHINMFSTQKIN